MSGRAVLAGLLVAAIVGSMRVDASDWPTVHHDAGRSGCTADCVRGPYRLAWAAEFPGETVATGVEAIVAAGKVFVGTLHGTLWALDRDSGKPVWTHRADGPIGHSPAFADGRVFCADAGGTLAAVDAASGKPVWQFHSGKGGFVASPLVSGGTVYLGARDGSFYAVAADTGRLRWRLATGGPIRGTAARAGAVVLFASDDLHAYAVDAATGRLVWKSAKLVGQSFRDYYPVVAGDRVIFRSVLLEETNDDLNGGTTFLQRRAGVSGGWRELEAFFRSDKSRGTPAEVRAEQEAILKRLADDPARRTCFVLDRATGQETARPAILYVAGNGGCPVPPVRTADGRLIAIYRTVYGNWSHGVKPAVGLGVLDLADGRITPLRHRGEKRPPWNTFWGTSDETTNLSVGGDLLYLTHQGTLSSFDLKTNDLARIHGERDTWGGLQTPIWAANEWHGPARGAVAISDDSLFWVTGSRVLCVRGGSKDAPPARPPAEAASAPGRFTPGTGTVDAAPGRRGGAGRRDGRRGDEALRTALGQEVDELLAGWPWAPLHLQMGIGGRTFYFAHPSAAVQALALAYPHLGAEAAGRAREAARGELAGCLNPDLLSLDRGRRRALRRAGPCAVLAAPAGGVGPGGLHAVWLYGDRTGDWAAIKPLWPAVRAAWGRYTDRPLAVDAKAGAARPQPHRRRMCRLRPAGGAARHRRRRDGRTPRAGPPPAAAARRLSRAGDGGRGGARPAVRRGRHLPQPGPRPLPGAEQRPRRPAGGVPRPDPRPRPRPRRRGAR
ncbi:MAG: PQQ-binding-like beta-propeller repeat protein [Gemmataceae bacterium]